MAKAKAVVENPLDFLFTTKDLVINGHTLKFRELSVQESDSCLDAARKPDGTIDGRLNMRMIISKSSSEPKITIDDIAKFPNKVYVRIAEFVNDLNSLDDSEEEEEVSEDGEETPAEGNE